MTKFPKTLCVTRENEDTPNDEYWQVHEAPEYAAEIGEGKRVGVYELKEVVTVVAEIKVRHASKKR